MTVSSDNPVAARDTEADPAAVRAPMVLHARVVRGTGGGPEKTILSSPRFLRPLGYESLCAYMHPPADEGFETIRQRAAELEAPLLGYEDRGVWDLSIVARLLRMCRQHDVAIWHGHDYKSNALGLVLRRMWPMRLVTTAHGWVKFTKRTPLYYGIDRFCLRYYEKVICVSDDLLERCRHSGIRPERLHLVHNAIDTDRFRRRQSAERAKRELGFDPRRLLIGAAGRLSSEKGFDRLITAAGILVQKGRPADLVIAGEGDQADCLREQIARAGLADRVRLLGYHDDIVPLLEALDIFALSSLREGLPNVVLEAMALEVPVVATRVAGVPRLIEDGRNGLLVEPGSSEQLAAALDRLLGDAALRTQLAAASRRCIGEQYNFASRMSEIAAIYDHLLARKQGAGP